MIGLVGYLKTSQQWSQTEHGVHAYMANLSRPPKKRHRQDEVWALQQKVARLEDEVARLQGIEGSIDALVEETQGAMEAYSDFNWDSRKLDVFEEMWKGDYSDAMLLLHKQFPALAQLVYRLVVGQYRTNKLELPGVSDEMRARDTIINLPSKLKASCLTFFACGIKKLQVSSQR